MRKKIKPIQDMVYNNPRGDKQQNGRRQTRTTTKRPYVI